MSATQSFCAKRSGVAESIVLVGTWSHGPCDFAQGDSDFAQGDSDFALVNDLAIGLSAEIKARRQQYEHYRDRLLTFKPGRLGGQP